MTNDKEKYTKKILNFKPRVPEVTVWLNSGVYLVCGAGDCAPPFSAKIVDKIRKRNSDQ